MLPFAVLLIIQSFKIVFYHTSLKYRDIRHGDPVALNHFIFCAESLAILIKQSKNTTGIFAYDREHNISQYVDDMSLILDISASFLLNAF